MNKGQLNKVVKLVVVVVQMLSDVLACIKATHTTIYTLGNDIIFNGQRVVLTIMLFKKNLVHFLNSICIDLLCSTKC